MITKTFHGWVGKDMEVDIQPPDGFCDLKVDGFFLEKGRKERWNPFLPDGWPPRKVKLTITVEDV
jgi:hypothetical protein